ncbi:MAG: HlyD family secretion protein [Litorimonas sp.]
MDLDGPESQDAPLSTVIRTSISSWTITLIGLLVVTVTASTLLLGNFSDVVRSSGWLKPDKGLVKVLAPQFGNVEHLHVRQGDEVAKGQPIATLDLDTNIVGNRKSVEASLSEIDKQIDEHTLSIELSYAQNQQSEKALRREINSLEEELDLILTEARLLGVRMDESSQLTDRFEDLFKNEVVSMLELRQQREQNLILQQSMVRLEKSIVTLREQINAKKSDAEAISLTHQQLLSEKRRITSGLRESKYNLAQRGIITLVSPIDGRIAAIPLYDGLSVTQNELIATVLPSGGKLEAEIFVPSKDASLINIGQDARIKFHGFPYQRYGVMKGTVSSFSKTIFLPGELSNSLQSNEPVYRIVVEIEEQSIRAENGIFPLQSGMTLDADIVRGKIKLWQLFFTSTK